MNSISVSSWLKKMILVVIIPLIVVMRFLSWNKIHANKIYFAFQEIQHSIVELDVSSLPVVGKVIFFLLESVPALCVMLILLHFLKILACFRQKLFFSPLVIQRLKYINMIALVWAIYGLLFETFASLLISAFKPAGQRCVAVAIGHENIAQLFLVLVLFMILQVIQAAHQIKAEQDLVV